MVANQRSVVRSKSGEMQVGGVIYSDSADKAARFIMNCNQKRIPLVFIQDVTGFMVGKRAEQGGIIKDGAKWSPGSADACTDPGRQTGETWEDSLTGREGADPA